MRFASLGDVRRSDSGGLGAQIEPANRGAARWVHDVQRAARLGLRVRQEAIENHTPTTSGTRSAGGNKRTTADVANANIKPSNFSSSSSTSVHCHFQCHHAFAFRMVEGRPVGTEKGDNHPDRAPSRSRPVLRGTRDC
jgi:hypothetical protein